MRFAHDFTSFPVLLVAVLCGLLLIGFAAALVLSSVARVRAEKRFGEPVLMAKLESFDATARRAWKGVLLVVAMAAAFAALARPQYGKGTRLVPATNLDVVIVLDYSKSMYARDVVPSRIARAKAEVASLIQGLPGARFGAVAFAGEPMSFPLTSDGAAIAQFFRQQEPNDMPIGGTATAKALESAREVLARDPKSKDHVRVIVLVTDGEDLEGDPVEVANAAAQEGTRIDVVAIGGRAPEVIPEVGPDGKVIGIRSGEDGKPLMTSLSADGEAQLAKIAQVTNGRIVQSEKGQTGIDEIARGLSKMMREELSEKVETVYAEVYGWPLFIALLLFFVEAMIDEAPKRWRRTATPPTGRKKRGGRNGRIARAANTVQVVARMLIVAMLVAACGWNPSKPFERESPEVNKAIASLDAGQPATAAQTLETYLSTGECKEGNIGTPAFIRKRPDGTFDLGLSLFKIGEIHGQRFGDEENDAGSDEPTKAKRHAEVGCAERVVHAIAEDKEVAIELRARASFLEGNLAFLDARYEDAVRAYDQALVLAPGQPLDAGDEIGRDAAWNRSIALRRIEDKKNDGGSDAGNDAPNEGGDAPNDANDGGGDAPNDGGSDGSDGSNGKDPDASSDNDSGQPPPESQDGGAPPPQTNQDQRILDDFEKAPTFQQEAAKRRGKERKVRVMVDK